MAYPVLIASSEFMVLLGLNVLIQSTLIAGIALLISLLFRRQASLRYGVLALALLLIGLCPFAAALMQVNDFSLLGWEFVSLESDTADSAIASGGLDEATGPDGLLQLDNPLNANSGDVDALRVDARQAILKNHCEANAHDTENAAFASSTTDLTSPWPSGSGISVVIDRTARRLGVVWGVGLVTGLLRFLIAFVRLRSLVRNSHAAVPEHAVRVFDELACKNASRTRDVQLVCSDEILSPFATGIISRLANAKIPSAVLLNLLQTLVTA